MTEENDEGMVAKYLNKATKFYSLGLRHIRTQIKFLGTQVDVSRPKPGSKWKNVFGGSYSSTDEDIDTDFEHFETRLLLSINEMRDVWNRQRDTVEVWADESRAGLEVGDVVSYSREGLVYRFKVIQKTAFSEAAKDIWIYTLASIIETKEL